MPGAIPSLDQVQPHTPLQLSIAAAFASSDDTMTTSGLRREAVRGLLGIALQEDSAQHEVGRT